MEKEKKEIVEVTDNGVVDSPEENDFIVNFRKPYIFEGETFDSIDLSGLENLRAGDMIAVNKAMERGGSVNMLPEMSLEYACLISAKAAKKPVEFFQQLPPWEAIKVKNRVTSFLYGRE